MTEEGFVAQVEKLYTQEPDHILPYIGDGFRQPQEHDLRMMVVGINSYSDSRRSPEDFAQWFKDESHRFFPAARKALRALSDALPGSSYFEGLRYRDPESAFATNMVKSYLPRKVGRDAVDVPDGAIERGHAVWRQELDLMAQHGVLPHVIVVLGGLFWATACRTLSDPPEHLKVHEHVWTGSPGAEVPPGPSLHFVNRYEVEGSAGRHPLLLVRLYHPSARKRRDATGVPRGTAPWWLGQADFRFVAGLNPASRPG